MFSGFQYNSSRAVLNIEAKEIAQYVGMHAVNLVRIGKTANLDEIPCHKKNTQSLKSFFEEKGLRFTGLNSITLINTKQNKHCILSRFQLKASRIATRLTQEELSLKIGLSSTALGVLESLDNHECLKSAKIDIYVLRSFFEVIGISYPDSNSIMLYKNPELFF